MNSIYATCYILGAHPRTAFWIIGKCANTFLEHVITIVVAGKKDFTRKDLACFLVTRRQALRAEKKYLEANKKIRWPKETKHFVNGKFFKVNHFKMGGW